jgi:hypothetical protein
MIPRLFSLSEQIQYKQINRKIKYNTLKSSIINNANFY